MTPSDRRVEIEIHSEAALTDRHSHTVIPGEDIKDVNKKKSRRHCIVFMSINKLLNNNKVDEVRKLYGNWTQNPLRMSTKPNIS